MSARVFKDFRYQTRDSWSSERRVIGKAEFLEKGANPRFVLTSLSPERLGARALYEDFYCARGDMENRIKGAPGELAPVQPVKVRWEGEGGTVGQSCNTTAYTRSDSGQMRVAESPVLQPLKSV